MAKGYLQVAIVHTIALLLHPCDEMLIDLSVIDETHFVKYPSLLAFRRH